MTPTHFVALTSSCNNWYQVLEYYTSWGTKYRRLITAVLRGKRCCYHTRWQAFTVPGTVGSTTVGPRQT